MTFLFACFVVVLVSASARNVNMLIRMKEGVAVEELLKLYPLDKVLELQKHVSLANLFLKMDLSEDLEKVSFTLDGKEALRVSLREKSVLWNFEGNAVIVKIAKVWRKEEALSPQHINVMFKETQKREHSEALVALPKNTLSMAESEIDPNSPLHVLAETFWNALSFVKQLKEAVSSYQLKETVLLESNSKIGALSKENLKDDILILSPIMTCVIVFAIKLIGMLFISYFPWHRESIEATEYVSILNSVAVGFLTMLLEILAAILITLPRSFFTRRLRAFIAGLEGLSTSTRINLVIFCYLFFLVFVSLDDYVREFVFQFFAERGIHPFLRGSQED